MEITELQLSNHFFHLLLWGSILFVFFRAIRFCIHLFIKNEKIKQYIKSALLIAEPIIWIVFLSGFAWSINSFSSPFVFIILAIVFALLFWLSRFWIKDTIAGIIFRSSSRFSVGDIIQSENSSGVIKKFRNYTLELENKEGKTIFLPYGKVLESAQVKSESISKQSGYTFTIQCEANTESIELINRIKNAVNNLPWSSAVKKPLANLVKKASNMYEIEITVYPIDKIHQGKIEHVIREEFELK